MGLISNSNRLKIKTAIKSVTDTFFQKPIIYIRRTTSTDEFQENRSPQEEQRYNLLAFVKFNAGPGGIGPDPTHPDGGGSYDNNDGYVLFHIEDLRAVGMIDEQNNFIGSSLADLVIYQETTLIITGSVSIAQFIDENLLVRMAFKKRVSDG